jgi:hypothetical protein
MELRQGTRSHHERLIIGTLTKKPQAPVDDASLSGQKGSFCVGDGGGRFEEGGQGNAGRPDCQMARWATERKSGLLVSDDCKDRDWKEGKPPRIFGGLRRLNPCSRRR